MSERPVDSSEVLARARRSWLPPAGAAERVRRGLDAKVAAGAPAAASAAASVWPARLLLAGAFAVAAGGAGYWAGYRAGGRAAPSPVAAVAPLPSVAPAPPLAAAPVASRPVIDAPPVPVQSPSRRDTRGVRRGADSAPARQDSSLAIELRAVRNAERALRDGSPGLALAFLRDLDRQVPHGELAEEREATATLARCAQDDQPFDLNLGEQFAARHPTSVYRARVEQACARTDATASGDSTRRRSGP